MVMCGLSLKMAEIQDTNHAESDDNPWDFAVPYYSLCSEKHMFLTKNYVGQRNEGF